MPVSAVSLDKVADAVSRMQALRTLRQQQTLAIADNPDAVLDAATVTAIKTNMLATYNNLAAIVKAETATW